MEYVARRDFDVVRRAASRAAWPARRGARQNSGSGLSFFIAKARQPLILAQPLHCCSVLAGSRQLAVRPVQGCLASCAY